MHERRRKKDQAGVPAPGMSFIDIVKLLHETFGGNYRALEFFNRLLSHDTAKIEGSLASLERFRQDYAHETEAVKEKMRENLLFEKLAAMLDPDQEKVLAILSRFRRPVLEFALEMQLHGQAGQALLPPILPRPWSE